MELDVVAVRLIKERKMKNIFSCVETSRDAAVIFHEFLADMDREVMALLTLDSAKHPINVSIVSIGTLNNTLVHPREIFKAAILSNASDIIIAHNHPSGDLLPSKYDTEITERLMEVGKILGIHVVDHIIVGENNQYYSFSENDYDMTGHHIGIISEQNQERKNELQERWQKVLDRQSTVHKTNKTNNFVRER